MNLELDKLILGFLKQFLSTIGIKINEKTQKTTFHTCFSMTNVPTLIMLRDNFS